MGTRGTFLQKPTIEIDQDRYEELIQNELKYKQYKQVVDGEIVNLIETENLDTMKEEEE